MHTPKQRTRQTKKNKKKQIMIAVSKHPNRKPMSKIEKRKEKSNFELPKPREFTLFLREGLLRCENEKMWGLCPNTSSSPFSFGLLLDW